MLAWQSERSFLVMKESLQLKQLLIIRTTEFTHNLQQTLMILWEQFTFDKSRVSSWSGCSLQILEITSDFHGERVKIDTDLYINNILVQSWERRRNTLKISLSPSITMEHYSTNQEKLTTGANVIFQCSGVSIFDLLHRLIWIQLIFRSSLCWNRSSILLLIQVLMLWKNISSEWIG